MHYQSKIGSRVVRVIAFLLSPFVLCLPPFPSPCRPESKGVAGRRKEARGGKGREGEGGGGRGTGRARQPAAHGQLPLGPAGLCWAATCDADYLSLLSCEQKCGDTGAPLIGLPRLRPLKFMSISKRQKTVSRAYGGTLCGKAVRERIVRAFLVEEKKYALKLQKKAA